MPAKEWLTKEEFFAEDDADPEMQALRARTALARAVAKAVVGYRIKQGLSQRALAARLGIRQPHVALLERGDRTPSVETLQRLASVLGLRFVVDIAPAAKRGEQEPPPGLEVVQDVTSGDGSRVLVAAG